MILKGSEIKLKRMQYNIKQKDLANKLNITIAHLCNVEKENTNGLNCRVKATEYFNNLDKNNQEEV